MGPAKQFIPTVLEFYNLDESEMENPIQLSSREGEDSNNNLSI